MQLCSIPNQTYAVPNINVIFFKSLICLMILSNILLFLFIFLQSERLLAIKDGKEMIGIVGKIYDVIFIKKSLRKCKLIGEANLGEKIAENGTYNGNLGMAGSSIRFFNNNNCEITLLNVVLKCFRFASIR